jgi:hypothetical protein
METALTTLKPCFSDPLEFYPAEWQRASAACFRIKIMRKNRTSIGRAVVDIAAKRPLVAGGGDAAAGLVVGFCVAYGATAAVRSTMEQPATFLTARDDVADPLRAGLDGDPQLAKNGSLSRGETALAARHLTQAARGGSSPPSVTSGRSDPEDCSHRERRSRRRTKIQGD